MKLLYKYDGRKKLFIAGHFNNQEIKELRHDGYRYQVTQYNKHGIRVEESE